MSGPQELVNSRKRQRTEQRQFEGNMATSVETAEAQRSLQRISPTAGKQIVEDLVDQRRSERVRPKKTPSAPNPPHSPYRRTHRPFTRNFAGLNLFRKPCQSASDSSPQLCTKSFEGNKATCSTRWYRPIKGRMFCEMLNVWCQS